MPNITIREAIDRSELHARSGDERDLGPRETLDGMGYPGDELLDEMAVEGREMVTAIRVGIPPPTVFQSSLVAAFIAGSFWERERG